MVFCGTDGGWATCSNWAILNSSMASDSFGDIVLKKIQHKFNLTRNMIAKVDTGLRFHRFPTS
jgi:hypothetical protein